MPEAAVLEQFRCEEHDKPFKSQRGLDAHRRQKHIGYVTQVIVSPEMEQVFTAPVSTKPAIIPEWQNRIGPVRPSGPGRSIKMLRPICATCQRPKGSTTDWWRRCTHNPYISFTYKVEKVRRYEPVKDENGNSTGAQRLAGEDEIRTPVEYPNLAQIAYRPRVHHGTILERKRQLHGFIFPEELRTPVYPNGIKNPCEFRDCFVQTTKRYRWGDFCREIEAQLVGHDHRMDGGGGALEIGDSVQSAEKQRRQLEEVPLH